MIYVAYFFAGAFLINSLPHLAQGTSGHPFQSPFAKPPGKGLSSSKINFLWGFANLIAAYALLVHVGDFDLHNWVHVGAVAAGAFMIGFHCSHHFGKLHGGNI